jgi:hypothetical protein
MPPIAANHPCIDQAIERGLVSRESVYGPSRPTATVEKKPRRKTPEVRTQSRGGWSIRLKLACRVVSEANRRDHWTVAARRAEIQAEALVKALDGAGLTDHHPPLPVLITFTRIGRQTLDTDNLARAFKALRDRLAEWIGVDDGDVRVEWQYVQIQGEPGVTVAIASRT